MLSLSAKKKRPPASRLAKASGLPQVERAAVGRGGRHVSTSRVLLDRLVKRHALAIEVPADSDDGDEAGMDGRRGEGPASLGRTAKENGKLVSSLVSRVSTLERSRRDLGRTVASLEHEVARLKGVNAQLRRNSNADVPDAGVPDADTDAEAQLAVLRKSNQDMLQFLADYGLAWRGGDDNDDNFDADDEKIALQTGSEEQPNIDMDNFLMKLHELNALVEDDGDETSRKSVRSGINTIHSLREREKDRVELHVFADGFVVQNGPFRAFKDAETLAFVRDVTDGYFPPEFKHQHPDGLRFDVDNLTSTKFEHSKPPNRPSTAEAVLKQVPRFVIRDGVILKPRESLARTLGADVAGKRAGLEVEVERITGLVEPLDAKLLVHYQDDGGKRRSCLVQANAEETAGQVFDMLESRIACLARRRPYSLQTALGASNPVPHKSPKSIRDCGWAPNAVLYATSSQ